MLVLLDDENRKFQLCFIAQPKRLKSQDWLYYITMEEIKLISIKSAERLLKAAGAGRISKKARIALKEFLEEKGKEIAELAARNARHFGRKEIKEIDVKEAINLLER